MNRASVTRRINLMETAYLDILVSVPPGTPGKLDALEKLRKSAHELYVSFSTNNSRIYSEGRSHV